MSKMFRPSGPDQASRTQTAVLRSLVKRAAGTDWGRRYGYGEIAAESDVVAAYQRRVGIHSYDNMRRYVERIRDGESDVLWPGRIKYFAASSGTTSSGRVVPVSRDMLASNRRFSLRVVGNYIRSTGRMGILFGKHLSLPGWIEDDRQELGTRLGQISAILAESSAALSVPWRAIDNRLGFIEDWEEKMAAVADRTMHQDVRLVVIAPSWCQVLFRLVTERYKLATGRAATVGEIWPNLTTVITGGVALSGYRDILEHYIGRPGVDLVETYGASEGFISYQNDLSDPAMLIHPNNGVFFEFVPMDELGSTEPSRLTLGEVRTGVRYAVHVTSNSGFWSYHLGDVVRFTSTDPYKIVVAGRTVDMLDKYGEAVFGDEARAALTSAAEASGASVLQYHVTHIERTVEQTPAHHWLIEFEDPPADLESFAAALDVELKRRGHHYEDRREGEAFASPVVTSLKPGTFFGAMEADGKRLSVQTKVPAMLEERTFADKVLRFASER